MPKCEHKLSALAAALAAIFSQHAHAAGAATVDFATSGVNAVGADGQSRPIAKGGELAPGEMVDTGNGRAQLRFSDGGLVSLQPRTQFRLESYGYDRNDSSKNSIVMNLLKGSLRTITGLIGKTNRQGYKLQTATATIGIRGTEFSITGFPDGSILFHTAEGSIDVSNQAGSTTLNGGQSAYVNNPNSPPTQTDDVPYLPPVVYLDQTNLPPPTNPVQDATPNPVILTGTVVGGQWATISKSAGSHSSGYGGAFTTFTLDQSGHLTSYGYGSSPTSLTFGASLGAAGTQSYGNDGVMAWGRWLGGPANGPFGSTTYAAGDPLHYVVGLPVTSMPTGGTATYSLYGGTAPTCIGPACGAITVNSSITVNFGQNTGTYGLSVFNSGDGARVSGTGNLSFSNAGVTFTGSNSNMSVTGVSNGYGSSNITGFLAGHGASNAGAVYNVNYSGSSTANPTGSNTYIAGAAVYKR